VDSITPAGTKSFTRGVSFICSLGRPLLINHPFSSVVKFTLNLHDNCEVPLSEAYATAVAQYRSLRSEHRVATAVAVLEAEAMGAQFGPTEIERGFELETAALKSWESDAASGTAGTGGGKQWSAEAPGGFPGSWTRGEDYVARWKEGAIPYVKDLENEPSSSDEDLFSII
jgi:small subunit ribosomal protein S23